MLSSLEAFPEVQQMPAFSPCLIILSFLPNMFLVASLTLCTFSSSSPSPKFKVTISNPEKDIDGGVLFHLSPSLCLCALVKLLLLTLKYRRREWEPMSPLLLGLCDTFFHQVKATGMCEMKVGACPSAGIGDRCWVGSTAAARSERLRCQMKDLLSWEEQAVPSTCCIQDSPLQRRGAGAVLTLPTWVLPPSSKNCSQHLQRRWSLIALIGLGVEGEMMFTLIQALFFFLFWHEMSYMALPILCPLEPAGCWGFSSVPWQELTLVFAKNMCQQISAGGSSHALFR